MPKVINSLFWIKAIFTVIILLLVLIEFIYFLNLKPFYYPSTLTADDFNISFEPNNLSLEKKLGELSLEEKVGMLFIIGFNGQTLTPTQKDFFQNNHFRNFLLLSKNINSPDQLIELTQDLQSMATSSAHVNAGYLHGLIAIDQEGGSVNRINFANIENISQPEIKDINQAYQVAKDRGEMLKSFHINMNLAPVLEVIRDDKSYIAKQQRAFLPNHEGCSCSRPSDEEQIFQLGQAMVKGYTDDGIISVPKHFPGGLVRQGLDPHRFLPTVDIGSEDLAKDIYPYQKLIQHDGLQALMVSHILYPQLDHEVVASLSNVFLTEILREKLKFKGIIMIDDLAMRAITDSYTIPEASFKALQAGADMLIISDDALDQESAYQQLLDAIDQGKISEERINQSVRKILNLDY